MTPEYVRSLFDYDADIGELRWTVARSRRVKVGDIAGWKTKDRYATVGVDGRVTYVHRLVWLWHGRELSTHIDHIDGNKQNNRIENLRLATPSQNIMNCALRKTSRSGVKGVSWNARKRKWHATIQKDGKVYWIGQFDSLGAAESAVVMRRTELHQEFARQA